MLKYHRPGHPIDHEYLHLHVLCTGCLDMGTIKPVGKMKGRYYHGADARRNELAISGGAT